MVFNARTSQFLGHCSAYALILAVSAAGYSSAAFAQTESGAASVANASDTSEIIVTGSRVGRSTFTSPNPVTVIGADQIAKLGQVNLAETLQTIPQNVATVSDTNTGLTGTTTQYNIGAQIANLRGLNPFNGVRTLTLVNTKRFVPSTTGGGVDLNLIPSLLVQRVETVTGGASAAYGTDALAGVVNVILDTKLKGIKTQIDYGQTFENDGGSFHAALAAGFEFAGGRGHTIFGAEYQNSQKVGDCVYVRSWCAKSPDIFMNEANATNGLPRYIRGNNGAYTNYDLSAVLRVTPTSARSNPPGIRGLVFSADGRSVMDYDPGKFTQASGFFERQGGDCTLDCSPWSEVQLRPSVKRASFYSHTEFEFTPSIKGTLEMSYGFRNAFTQGLSLGPSSATVIYPDNFYLKGVTYFDRATGTTKLLTDLIAAQPPYTPSATGVSQAPGVPQPALFLGKHFRNVPGGRSATSAKLDTYRIQAGLEGDLPWLEGWKWDAYYQYGKTKQHVEVTGLRVNSYFSWAIDAVDQGLATTGVANGVPVCRATLPGPMNSVNIAGGFQLWNAPEAAGCIPLNILGANTENPAATAYAYRTSIEDFKYQQHVAAFNLRGDLFDGWAGPIGLAAGGEYRFETGDTVHNTPPFGGFTTTTFGKDFGGDLRIFEGYLEANIPVLKDLPLIDLIEVNAAYRRTEQKNTDHTSGNSKDLHINTWKVSGTWDVTDWLRFRATHSRDVRAASFVDLYYNENDIQPGPPNGTAFNPWNLVNGVAANDSALISYPANFTLKPEIGKTTTFGVVLQPKGFLRGLRISADYYDIKISDAIVVLTTQQSVDACFQANVGCNFIYNPAGVPFSELAAAQRTDFGTIARGARNIGSFQQRGWDLEMEYRRAIGPGDLSIRALATIVDKMVVNLGNGSGALNYVGQTGGSAFGGFTAPADYIVTTYATYEVGGFSFTVDTKYVPQGIYDIRRDDSLPNTNNNSINTNNVDSKFYVGLASSYKFSVGHDRTIEVFAAVRNLFNVTPPNAPSGQAGTGGYVQGVGAPTNPIFYDTIGAQWRAGVRVNF